MAKNTTFIQAYYDLIDIESKKLYLKNLMSNLENVRGKKVIITTNDGKKKIAKTAKYEYIKYLNMLKKLEQLSEEKIQIIETTKTEELKNDNQVNVKKELINVKRKLVKLALSASCALSIIASGKLGVTNISNDDDKVLSYELENQEEPILACEDVTELVINEVNELAIDTVSNNEIPINLKEIEYDTFISTYAEYYNLDGTKVVELAKELTNNYTIPFAEINNSLVDGTGNPEVESMMFVTRLYGDNLAIKLKSIGHNINEYKVKKEMRTLPSDLIMQNGLHYNDYLAKIADMMELDKNWALAISFHETGIVTSNRARNKNNFGGLGNMVFPTPEAGIMYYCCNLKEYQKIVHNMHQLSGRYVNGNINSPSEHWESKVRWFYNSICNNPEKYYFQEQNNTLSLTK